jgi:hypothetical protein
LISEDTLGLYEDPKMAQRLLCFWAQGEEQGMTRRPEKGKDSTLALGYLGAPLYQDKMAPDPGEAQALPTPPTSMLASPQLYQTAVQPTVSTDTFVHMKMTTKCP